MRPGLTIITTFWISRLALLRWDWLSLYPVFWYLHISLNLFDDIFSMFGGGGRAQKPRGPQKGKPV